MVHYQEISWYNSRKFDKEIVNEIHLSVKNMALNEMQRPGSLDLKQLEQILEGIEQRARKLL